MLTRIRTCIQWLQAPTILLASKGLKSGNLATAVTEKVGRIRTIATQKPCLYSNTTMAQV